MADVLVAHARRWRDIGASPGDWMTLALCLAKGDQRRVRGADRDPVVAAAASSAGASGLSFVAACVWPPPPPPAVLPRTEVDAAGLPW